MPTIRELFNHALTMSESIFEGAQPEYEQAYNLISAAVHLAFAEADLELAQRVEQAVRRQTLRIAAAPDEAFTGQLARKSEFLRLYRSLLAQLEPIRELSGGGSGDSAALN